jgi:DNA-nicking Smr family endonuclease
LKKPSGKGGRRHLDDDEAADWDHTAKTIEPLKRAKSRVRAAREAFTDEEPPRRVEEAASAPARGRAKTVAPIGPAAAPIVPVRKKAVPPIADFDRKTAKRLRSGRVEIEGRLDLHGMRQDEAHHALRAFLIRAHGRGLRWVLIITGKGNFSGRANDTGEDVIPVRDRGVLKRNVPRWLEEPDLRALVVSFTEAAAAHGGDGALYVHLRKNG